MAQIKSTLSIARKQSASKSRPGAPRAGQMNRQHAYARNTIGALGDPGRFFIPGQGMKRGIVHFGT